MPLLTALNWQWGHGAPSGDLSGSGLLVHVLDGRGININGFLEFSTKSNSSMQGLPDSGRRLWQWLGRPDSLLRNGDRTSASIINRQMPAMYAPLNVVRLTRAGYGRLPFVILNTNVSATRRRISCCYAFDVGSTKLGCTRRGGDGNCTPGCSASSVYMESEAKGAGWDTSVYGGPFDPRQLRQCLDAMKPRLCRERRRYPWCAMAYNEVILDRWRSGGWELDTMVWAIGVARGASAASVELAREVQVAAAQQSGLQVPLLLYDRRRVDAPFSMLQSAAVLADDRTKAHPRANGAPMVFSWSSLASAPIPWARRRRPNRSHSTPRNEPFRAGQ